MTTDFGKRLKTARKHAKLTQVQLAKAAGIGQSTLAELEKAGYGSARVANLAEACGVSVMWLAEGQGTMESSNVSPGPDTHGPYPLISDVQAGTWTAIADNFQPGEAEQWLPSAKSLGTNGYLLRVSGDSMTHPGGRYSFPAGMILHINPSLVPQPGQFVIVRRNGNVEATFKRYVLLDGEPYLEAINPDWPKEKRFLKLMPGDDWCGVVVDASLGSLP